jgi:GAF domain-containing protein
MKAHTREGRLVDAFVALADTLVVGYDVVDLLHTLVDVCADLLDAAEAGLLLAGASGELAVVASTSEKSRLVELMQLTSRNGPCIECYTSGAVVAVPDIDSVSAAWPEFHREAADQGFRAVHAVPLRLRGTVLGTLNLFLTRTGTLSADDASAAQGEVAQEQLQYALNSRVVIEQAKGVIAQTRTVDVDTAFGALRQYARSHNLNLRDVAEQVVARVLVI